MLQKRCVLEHVCQELGFDLPLKQEDKKVLVNVEENTEEIRKALVQFFDLEGTSDEAAAAGSNGRFSLHLQLKVRKDFSKEHGRKEVMQFLQEEVARLGSRSCCGLACCWS